MPSSTRSMTSYAQSSTPTEYGELSCELRSVNHRYLEIAPRMPEELRQYEGELRETISNLLARGRVDCFIRLKEDEVSALEPNIEMVQNLQSLISQMQEQVPEMQPQKWQNLLNSA